MQKARRPNEACHERVVERSAFNQALGSELGGARDPGPAAAATAFCRALNYSLTGMLELSRVLQITELHTRARSMISIEHELCYSGLI